MKNEDVKDGALTAFKALVEAIPVIGGSINIFLDHRSKIRQERINRFINILSDYFEKESHLFIDPNYITTEEFGDVFESVLRRIVTTNSQTKLNRFKNILIADVISDFKIDYIETFLDLTNSLNDKQIEILLVFSRIPSSIEGYYEQIPQIEREIDSLKVALENERKILNKGYANDFSRISESILRKTEVLAKQNKSIAEVVKLRKCEYFDLQESELCILTQDLVGKSLLVDIGLPILGIRPFQVLAITDFGKSYLEFIKEHH